MRRVRVAAAACVLLVVPSVAFAQDTAEEAERRAEELEQQEAEARQRAEQLEDQAGEVRDRVAELQVQADQVRERLAAARAELDELQPKLEAASVALSDAEAKANRASKRADEARAAAQRAQEKVEASLAELQANDDQRASVARHAYMYGPEAATPAMAALQMAEGTSPTEMADILHMLDVLLVDHGMLVEESVRLAEESRELAADAARAQQIRETQADAADEAAEQAGQRHAEMMALLAQAEQSVMAEAQAVAQLEANQAEADEQARTLEAAREQALTDADESGQAARQASERAEQLAQEAAEAAAAAAEAAAAAAAAESAAEETRAAGAGGTVSVRPVNGDLVTVGGITVAASLAPQLEALLNDARADGIVLGGYGYRSIQTTIRLRRANGCPDVYTSPPSSCRVPTARPGTSMHEQGLAVDFTWHGSTICFPRPPSRCHGNAAFDWLQANAHAYGLRGLSTEAWHYSTNGR